MLKLILTLLILALAQFSLGCDEGVYPYNPVQLSAGARETLEREKREWLMIEDLKVGDGPVASWGRKISADLEVRYTDGTLAYRGPAFIYIGMQGSVSIHNSISEDDALSLGQPGVWLGLNEMTVDGKRRFTIDPKLVCGDGREATPQAGCLLIQPNGRKEGIRVRKEKLIVEAILTESCIPVSFRALKMGGGYAIDVIVGCRGLDEPRRDPTAPIWHVY